MDKDPRIAAEYNCDKHVVKMILEMAQLLSTAHRILDNNTDPTLYKATHKNHPSAIWVRSGIDQYRWTYDHMCFLLLEYNYRYGKIHATDRLRGPLFNCPLNINYEAPWTEPPQAMPEDSKVENNSVQAYRNYYIKHKYNIAKWTRRQVPSWFSSPQSKENLLNGQEILGLSRNA